MAITPGWRVGLLFALSFLLIILGALCPAAEIVGPDSVPAGSGLVRLSADTGDLAMGEGSQLLWQPITPRDLDWVPVDGGIVFAATCAPSVVEVQLIDVAAITVDFHTVRIGVGPDPDPDPDPDPPDPPGPVADKLVIMIIEETQVRKPGFGDQLVDLRQWADTSPHTLLVYDDDTTAQQLAAYVSGDVRPLLVIDSDLDATEVMYSGDCPGTAAEIQAIAKKYTSADQVEVPGVRPDELRPALIPPAVEFVLVRVSGRRYARDKASGHMYAIDEQTKSFEANGKSYLVEPAK